MPEITLPHNGWKPRPYQLGAWRYLENGGTTLNLIAHRRAGKDELALHRTACAAFERVGTYWHLLPEAAHARKAIWTAVNPHTGKRRIDEAFPQELRKTTREQEMFIEFVNGSTWQVGGSDRYNTLVGSSPAGVVFSEWALANPAAWAYVRPILLENKGWAMFITTPRGHNHAERMFKAQQKDPSAYCEILTADRTGVFDKDALERERLAMIDEYGDDFGQSMFDQEYMCSFDAAILGSYYGTWITKAKAEGRVRNVPIDPAIPVHTAWDLGYTDDATIWFFQVPHGEVHILDCYADSGKGIDHYIDYLKKWLKTRPAAKLGHLNLPHDAKAKTFASNGKSTEEMMAAAFGWDKIRIVPSLSVQDGIQATREMLKISYFDPACEEGIEALGQYQREWDDKNKVFHEHPKHDWTSHYADAFRMAAVAYREEMATKPKPPPKYPIEQTINQLIAQNRRKRLAQEA